jgi:ketosteroid isomerase-like protein
VIGASRATVRRGQAADVAEPNAESDKHRGILEATSVLDLATVLRGAYESVNRGDIEPALSLMCPDVDWPNTIEGGREHGRDAVRAYWTRLFDLLVPRFDLLCVRAGDHGRIVVHVHQRFSDPATGRPLAHQHVEHVFTLRDALVARMDASGPKLMGPHGCGSPGCGQAARAM